MAHVFVPSSVPRHESLHLLPSVVVISEHRNEAFPRRLTFELSGGQRHGALAARCNMYLSISRPVCHAVGRPLERRVRQHWAQPRLYAHAHLRTVSSVRVVMLLLKVLSSRLMNTGPFGPGT